MLMSLGCRSSQRTSDAARLGDDQLRSALASEDPARRTEVLRSMGRTRPAQESLLPLVVVTIRFDPDPSVREAALGALGRTLAATGADVGYWSGFTIGLRDPELAVRRVAAEEAAGALLHGAPAGRAPALLRDALVDALAHPELFNSAAGLLGTLGPAARSSASDLIAATESLRTQGVLTSEAEAGAVRALGRLEPQDPAAIAWLLERCAEGAGSDREACAEAMGQLCAAPSVSDVILGRILTLHAEQVLTSFAKGVRDSESVCPSLIDALVHRAGSCGAPSHAELLEAVARQGPVAAAALPALVELVEGAQCPQAIAIVGALGDAGRPAGGVVVEALTKVLERRPVTKFTSAHAERAWRAGATTLVSLRMSDPATLAALELGMRAPEELVRASAGSAFAAVAEPTDESAAVLVERLCSESSETVRDRLEAGVKALSDRGAPAREVLWRVLASGEDCTERESLVRACLLVDCGR